MHIMVHALQDNHIIRGSISGTKKKEKAWWIIYRSHTKRIWRSRECWSYFVNFENPSVSRGLCQQYQKGQDRAEEKFQYEEVWL